MKILTEGKAVLLSLMTFKESEEEDWLAALRLKSEDAEPIAKALKSSGFNVTYVS